MNSWVRQTGYPVVKLWRDYLGSKTKLYGDQIRFLNDKNDLYDPEHNKIEKLQLVFLEFFN